MLTPLTIDDMEKMTREELENHILVMQADYERKHKQLVKLRTKYIQTVAVLKYKGLYYKIDNER